ncbi:MAG: hypothetical protein GTO71_02530 [Woeseiaceae bacterium]|nr:hypothetical protein [Woeseiaceae bacterium]NIP19987.1 hypothetical protein [Woeseiaceae bacterium]
MMRPNNILIAASFAWLLVSFWNRNDLPGNIDFVAEIANEPLQTPTEARPFHATVNDIDYLIEPEYAYDLTGMIVSYRHHEGNSRMHLRANDHLNMLDVCVVWGDNTKSDLHAIDFWNGIFTCNVFTRDMDAWNSFDMNQLSNNHLISDDEFIRRQVRKVQIGDQVRVRGYLASYSNEGGGKRGTSTTRTDTGDGACETVFVESFSIVEPATSYWRISMWTSLALLMAGLFVHFKRPYKPY